MGNTLQNLSESEHKELIHEIEQDRINGKPKSELLYLSTRKSLKDLKKIHKFLSEFYSQYELKLLSDTIKYKEKYDG